MQPKSECISTISVQTTCRINSYTESYKEIANALVVTVTLFSLRRDGVCILPINTEQQQQKKKHPSRRRRPSPCSRTCCHQFQMFTQFIKETYLFHRITSLVSFCLCQRRGQTKTERPNFTLHQPGLLCISPGLLTPLTFFPSPLGL